MGVTLKDMSLAKEWEDDTANIPCRDDNRFVNTEQIRARQIHIREALAYRCYDCVLYTMCIEYTDGLPDKPRGVIQAGRYYR